MSESPFNSDGIQFAWDSTSLGYAKDCWRKYYYTIIEGWRSKNSSVDLVFGGEYAKALETFHKLRANGADFDEAERDVVLACLQATAEWPFTHTFKTRENLIRSIIWYLETFRDDPCETVIRANGEAAVELSFRFEVVNDILLCGHMDRLVSYAGSYYVQDQKTTGATLGGYYFKRYSPDNQMSLYSLASKVVYGMPVTGVMIDAAQIAVGFTRFERGFAYRTDTQLNEWLADAMFVINDTSRARDQGWPMNDAACQKYGGCPFLEVCSKSPEVRSTYLNSAFMKRHWNPLENR